MAQIPPVADPPAGTPPAAAPPVPGAPPVAPPAPAEPPAALVAPPAPETLTMTSTQLDERLKRAQSTDRARWLKEQGFESEEAFATKMKAFEDSTAAAEEAKRLEMTELEKYKTDLAAANEAKTAAEAATKLANEAAESARTEAHLRAEFANRGIVNAAYAFHLVNQAIAELDEGATLNEVEFLDKLVADETQKAALGMAVQPPAEGLATTTPPIVVTPPPPNGPPVTDANAMSDAEWQAHKKAHNIR